MSNPKNSKNSGTLWKPEARESSERYSKAGSDFNRITWNVPARNWNRLETNFAANTSEPDSDWKTLFKSSDNAIDNFHDGRVILEELKHSLERQQSTLSKIQKSVDEHAGA